MKGLYRYNLNNQTWEFQQVNGKIAGRKYHKSALIGNELFIIFGRELEGAKNVPSIVKVRLNETDLKWETVFEDTSEFAADSLGVTVVENKIIGFGGFSSNIGDFTNHLFMFDTENMTFASLSENFLSPPSRYYHSMSLISGEFYVFGGRNQDTIFSDFWKFSPETRIWTPVETSGIAPSARYAFASMSRGDALAIWGGQGDIGLLNDMYIYNSLKKSWQLIEPTSTTLPKPAKGACLVINIPKIYIYGGNTLSGPNNELWVFNLWTNEYIHLSSDVAVSFPTCELDNEFFYVIFGSKGQGFPMYAVRKYELSTKEWTTHSYIKDISSGTIEGLQLFVNGDVLKIGGQIQDHLPNSEIYYLNKNGTGTVLGNIPESPYRAAYVYHLSSFYIYGGGEVVGENLRLGVSSGRLLKLSMREIMEAGNYNYECSRGSEATDIGCELCKAGSYSEGITNTSCTLCPEGTYSPNSGGTYNRQCYPCDNNYYNPDKGQVYCVDCPTGYECPTGSIKPLDLLIENNVYSIQPKLYNPNSVSQKIFNFELSVGIIFLGIILILFFFYKTRTLLTKIDLYTELHNYEVDRPMYLINNKFGGVFSLVFICLAVILFGITLINYKENNILETKGLVPKVVLDYEVDEYAADKFFVIVQFIRYGDKCLNESIDYFTSSMKAKKESITFELVGDTCVATFEYDSCVLSTGASLTIALKEKLCYSSGIYVNISSSSSIPNEISSILTIIKPSGNNVFIGTDPSYFYFTLTPSLFISESNKWPHNITGYHISSINLPVAGSEHESRDLAIASQLKVIISMDLSISGLLTKRSLIQDLGILFSSLIGSIFGVMGGVGGGMAFLEKRLGKFRKYLKQRKDFNKVSEARKNIQNEIRDKDKVAKNYIPSEEMNSENLFDSPRITNRI